ncbi:hypothetical protein OPV22_030929 [Ensete ventricosum]|uniref:Uncharacterized protein n=1 Tax=Ensete ventricosum TaxID=4639 RepID=A0AAV8PN44_ENSVE|nr:hypothetical protein OPV22_030929 [Ensete ventricosum]
MNKPNSLPFSLLLLALLLTSFLVVDAHNVICRCHRVHGHKKHNQTGVGQFGDASANDNNAGQSQNGTIGVTVSQNDHLLAFSVAAILVVTLVRHRHVSEH